jgi:hypothetical protein
MDDIGAKLNPAVDSGPPLRVQSDVALPEEARMDSDCIFCRIVAGQIPALNVARSERVVAFRDINPQAPLHVLVVPRDHHADVAQLAAVDPGLLADVVALAHEIAANSPLAVQGAKQVLGFAARRDVDAALDYVALWNSASLHSADLTEAMTAFMQRRKPEFRGQ